MLSVGTLNLICDFYSEASLQEDMARRIMISIIPSMMGPVELHHSGGFAYNELKAAAKGARDLIFYGTMACLKEFRHYGEPYAHALYNYDKDEEKQSLYEQCQSEIVSVASIVQTKQYSKALNIMAHHFANPNYWMDAYGGKPWAKIAEVLSQINAKYQEWQHIQKKELGDIDYLAAEMNVMKELIVLMNLFDGLAHNTSDVIDNLIEQELVGEGEADESEMDQMERNQRFDYIDKIKSIMNAKELEDPLDVYEEVKDILNNPSDRNIFKRWTKDIERNPKQRMSEFSRAAQLKLIQTRKRFMPTIENEDTLLRAKLSQRPITTQTLGDLYRLFGGSIQQMNVVIDAFWAITFDLVDDRMMETLENARKLHEQIRRLTLKMVPYGNAISLSMANQASIEAYSLWEKAKAMLESL